MKTKITVLLTAFCSILFSVKGSNITVQDAQNVALNFFKIATENSALGTPQLATLKYTRMEADGTISLYAFDMSPVKGFVIVSASDYDDPIIGYSTESAFTPNFSETGLNDWLSRWGEEIAYVERNHITAEPKVPELWRHYRQGTVPVADRSSGIGPLCTTSWSQSSEVGGMPVLYNEDCPYDINAQANTLTGCVATAMAQIMKYWNFPSRGTGIATYNDEVANGFSNNYGTLTFNFNTTPFNWANMPDNLTSNSTAAQDSAVSLLNYACGVSVSMDYGPDESGAWGFASESTNGASSQQAYARYFKYNPNTIQAVMFTNYTTSSWIALIENEFNAGRPVQYEGYSVSAGGHTWLSDGYNASNMMHMNWGWGGQYNGWYAVTNLTPSDAFTYNIGALIGIEPGIKVISTSPAICSGDTSVLSVTGAPVVATYIWAPSTGLSCTGCATPKASPNITTTYTVRIDSAGNVFTGTVTVYINHPHTLNYILSDSLLCNGNSVSLSLIGVSGVNISPASSLVWKDSLSAILTPDSTTTYHVTTQSSVCGTGDSANIEVQVTQHAPVTFNLSSNTICYGSDATLTYTGLSNVMVTPPGYSYSGGNNTLVFNPYSTTGFSISGTTSCGSVYTDTFTITVTSNIGGLSYRLSKPTICRGDTSILSVYYLTDVQVTPSNKVTSLGNYTYLLAPDSNANFFVTGYNSVCGGEVSAEIPVNVIQPGALSYSVATQDICQGGYEYIYLYGVTGNIQSNPPLYFYFSDSADAYAYFVADSTITYAISATTICGGNGSTNVKVVVLPEVSYNLHRESICQGDSTLYTVFGLTGISIYPATGFRMIDSSHYEFYPSATTAYELTGYDCTGGYNYSSFTIHVVQPGVLDYTLENSNLCSVYGTELALNGVYNPQITPYNYLYMSDSVDYDTYLYPSANTTYNISGQSVCGGVVSASFTVHVFALAGYSLGAGSVCPGGSTTLKLTGLTNPAIYPNNTVTWVNDSLAVLRPTTETDYELSGTDCTGEENQYNIVVGVLSDTNVTYSVDSELCSGGEAYLTVSGASNIIVTPSVNLTYTDSFDAYAYLDPTATTTYTMISKSECTNTNITDVFNVYIVETPSYSLTKQTICNSDSVVVRAMGLDNMVIAPFINVSYINANAAYLYPDTATTYTLSGNSSCTNQYYSQSFLINVDSIPAGFSLNITQSHDTLFASAAGSYQWILNNNPIQGANASFIVPASLGTYTVVLGVSSNCSEVSDPFNYTSINNLTENPAYQVYPNPSPGGWVIQTGTQAIGNTCEIFDNNGRLVYISIVTGSKYEIDTELSPGVYLLKILHSGQLMFISKLVKM